jgi:hypothetical protein
VPGPAGHLARRDLVTALGLGAVWAGMWGLYATYTWTAPAASAPVFAVIRFYLPPLGAIALLAAWPLVHGSRWLAERAPWAGAAVPVLLLAVLFGLGSQSFAGMTGQQAGVARVWQIAPGGPSPGQPAPARGPVPGPAG